MEMLLRVPEQRDGAPVQPANTAGSEQINTFFYGMNDVACVKNDLLSILGQHLMRACFLFVLSYGM